jgi:hypothetical protein
MKINLIDITEKRIKKLEKKLLCTKQKQKAVASIKRSLRREEIFADYLYQKEREE